SPWPIRMCNECLSWFPPLQVGSVDTHLRTAHQRSTLNRPRGSVQSGRGERRFRTARQRSTLNRPRGFVQSGRSATTVVENRRRVSRAPRKNEQERRGHPHGRTRAGKAGRTVGGPYETRCGERVRVHGSTKTVSARTVA